MEGMENTTIKITKLEREMFEAAGFDLGVCIHEDDTKMIKAVAEVAKKHIERAWNCAYGFAESKNPNAPSLSEWSKENGITEQPSIHQETGNDFKCFSLKAVPMCGFPQCGCKQD